MTHDELRLIAAEVGPLIKTYVAQVMAPLEARNRELEVRLLDMETRPITPPDRGERGEAGQKGDPGMDGAAGRDAIGISDALIDREGHLILTWSDGRMKDVGAILGRDGAAGRDGLNGKDGADGLGFDDWEMRVDPALGVVLEMRHGDRSKVFVCPQPFVVAKWTPGLVVPKGACTQWQGGYWMALKETAASPEEHHADWMLLVRRGKDGKEGKPGKDAPALRQTNTPPLYGG